MEGEVVVDLQVVVGGLEGDDGVGLVLFQELFQEGYQVGDFSDFEFCGELLGLDEDFYSAVFSC